VNTTPSVRDVAEAIETALKQISGLRTAAYLSDSISPPVALVAIQTVEFHGAFQGGDVIHAFDVYLVLARSDDRAALQAMESYMSQAGPNSLRAAIEADPTLGGVVSSAFVEKAGPPRNLAIGTGGAVYILVPFTVQVHA
jgi:hypothetical protein